MIPREHVPVEPLVMQIRYNISFGYRAPLKHLFWVPCSPKISPKKRNLSPYLYVSLVSGEISNHLYHIMNEMNVMQKGKLNGKALMELFFKKLTAVKKNLCLQHFHFVVSYFQDLILSRLFLFLWKARKQKKGTFCAI